MPDRANEHALAWDVQLPGKRASSLQGARPRATLVITGESLPEERLVVPAAVGRVLASKQRAEEVHPTSRAELHYIVSEVARSCASARIERLLNRRDYATSELTQKLRDDGYATATISDCVGRACALGLANDQRYADVFIRSKVAAGWGVARIERELGRRGIRLEEVRGWPYDYLDPDDELQRAVELAQTRRVTGERAFPKLVRFLCGRGFTVAVSVRAAREVLDVAVDDELVGF